ncbi:peptide ABC transporter substrate-binding protein [Phytoactinopolyspora mesophila]|uniref:ABC transporter substrate-binding protein n=1 Tax=Phytoactinopolyspora mesophila TaxID=2650750 RepID=A0A7K3M7G7_9ACTN|nr:ABC transporter substrate-binding protein [Phytoactinopolyspora mesophila]NDL59263.1 ABC transporter substrate-binding protein [Phytoactinopolyspora mesophila]
MIKQHATRVAALAAAVALLAAACGSDDDGEPGADAPDEAAEAGGEFTAYTCEPQFLVPGNSTEVCGSMVLEQLFSGLTAVNYETSEAYGVVATDWDTDDNVTWTFNLRDDFTFHNGDPVTAQTFADTWNWVVDPDNAQQNSNFFDNFVGYADVVEGNADEMEGVRVIDDTTLEIELTVPFSPLPIMLSYTAFYPLPDEAYEDIEAFEQAPVGNGRYEIDGSWEHDVQIAMDRYEDWPADNPGLADRIVWRIYDDINTAYLDVQAGNLDVLYSIPPERETTVESDFGDNIFRADTSSFTYMGLPLYQDEFQDPDIRHAMSMAIDRQAIIDAIFSGARTPATAVIPPVLAQHREDACNYCQYDPDTAADMYEAAGGPEELTVYFNSGAGHEDWTEAVANQWQQNLGVTDVTFESLEFAQYLDLHDNEEVTGPFRLGWVLSYPSPQYAMEPIYTTGQSSNYTGYANDEFDNLIREANGAPSPEEADALYQQAEDILLEDMPVIPMWYETRTVVFSDRVSNVEIDPRTFPRVEQVQVTE